MRASNMHAVRSGRTGASAELCRACVAGTAALLIGSGALAAPVTWNNSGTDFNAGGSWVGGNAPGSGDVATFSGAANPDFQPQLTDNITVSGIDFNDAAASGYVLSSTSPEVALTLSGSTAIRAAHTSGTNTISAPIVLGRAAGATFAAAGSGTLEISGNITESTQGTVLTIGRISAGGIIKLSGSNSYTGGTHIGSSNIVLHINSPTALGTGPLTIAANSPVLDNTSGAPIKITNSLRWTAAAPSLVFSGTNSLEIAGDITLHEATGDTTTNTEITVNGSAPLILSGSISDGAETHNLVKKASPGTLVLAGNNTYDGTTTVDINGAVRITHPKALGSTVGGTAVDGTLEMAGGITVVGEELQIKGTLRNISGDNEWAGPAIIYGGASNWRSDAGTLTISGNVNGDVAGRPMHIGGAGTVIFTGDIGSNVALVARDAGPGTAIFAGNNTYVGTTTVYAGTLLVNGTHTGADNYSVLAGATLGGNGTITLAAGKSVSVAGGENNPATIAPGASIGTLTVNGNVNFGNDSRLLIDVNGAEADSLVVSGALNLASTFNLDRLFIEGTPGGATSYVLVSYGSRSGVFDEVYFNGSLVADPLIGGIGDYRLEYGPDTGGSIKLVLVPEPAGATLLPLAAALLARRRRVA